VRLLLGVIAAAVALGAWAVSAPVGAAPDDDFHLASLWCAPTASADYCEPIAGTSEGEIRTAVSLGLRCFIIDETVSGACTADVLADDRRVRTDRVNFGGYNPAGFYALLGPLAGSDIEASVLAVRLTNAALFLVIVLTAFLLLPAARRPALVWGTLLTIVPMGLDLVPSTNPQSWTFGPAAVTLLAVLSAVEARGWRRWALAGLAVTATVIGVLARSDAAVIPVLTVGIVLLLRFTPSRRGWALLGGLAVLVLIAVIGLLSASQREYLLPRTGGYTLEHLGLAVMDTLAMPILWYRVLAGPVGWQDVPLSPVVGIVGGLLLLLAVATALRVGDRRMRWAIGLVIVALWLLPLYLLVNNGSLVGMYVQPRYVAPMVVLLSTLVLLRGAGTLRLPTWAAWTVAAALAVAHAAALHGVIRRYVTGTDVVGFDLGAQAEWWWPGAPAPMTVWLVGGVAWAVLLAVAVPLITAGPGDRSWRPSLAAAPQNRTRTSDAS